MRAVIKYRDGCNKRHQVTIQTPIDEPNFIVREAVRLGKVWRGSDVRTIQCGRSIYYWKGVAYDAFPERA